MKMGEGRGGGINGVYRTCITKKRVLGHSVFHVTLLSSFIWKHKALSNYMEAGTTLHCFPLAVLCPKQDAAAKGVVVSDYMFVSQSCLEDF